MKTIKEFCSKPSEAVRAMIDGLKEFDSIPSFIIDMSVFGTSDGNICHGCAATCAIQKLAGTRFTPGNIYRRDVVLGVNLVELQEFEFAVDNLRSGRVIPLLRFFGIDPGNHISLVNKFSFEWELHSYDWREQLYRIEEFYDALVKEKL